MLTAATFQGYEKVGINRYRVKVQLTDSITGIREGWLEDISGTTIQQLQDAASQKIASLKLAEDVGDLLAGITIGTSIPITYTAPAISADEVWLGQAGLLVRAAALKTVLGASTPSAMNTDLAGLVTAVANGYNPTRGGKL